MSKNYAIILFSSLRQGLHNLLLRTLYHAVDSTWYLITRNCFPRENGYMEYANQSNAMVEIIPYPQHEQQPPFMKNKANILCDGMIIPYKGCHNFPVSHAGALT